MLQHHIDTGAGVTVAGIRMPRGQPTSSGVIQTAADGSTIEAFLEKPADPPGIPDDPRMSYVSMGNYMFSTDTLIPSRSRSTPAMTVRCTTWAATSSRC